MPKPTIIQTLLGRPSQHYSFPVQKNYHSTKQEFIRAATEDRHGSKAGPSHTPTAAALILDPPGQSQPVQGPPARRRPHKRRRTLSPPNVRSEAPHAPEHLANSRCVIHTIASTEAPSQKQKADRYHAAVSPLYISPPGHPRSPARRPIDFTVEPGDDSDDDSDVYYTPSSSLAPSPAAVPPMLLEPQALATALLPIHGRTNLKSSVAPPTLSRDASFDFDHPLSPGPLTRTVSEAEPPPSAVVSRSSSDSSLSSSSALSVSPEVSDQDVTSIFDSGETTSTHATSHASAVGSVVPQKSEGNGVEVITIASTTRKPRPMSIDLSPSALEPRPRNHHRHHSQPSFPLRSDEDWAKDVRWLVPSDTSPTTSGRVKPPASDSPRRLARPLHPDLLPPLPADAPAIPLPHQLDRQAFPDLISVAGASTARPRPKGDRNSRHSSHRHSKTRMSALWEEDESEYASSDWGASSAEVSRASTPAPMPFVEGYMTARSSTPPLGWEHEGMGATSGPVVTSGVGAVGHGPLHPEFRNSLTRRPSMSESDLLDRIKRSRDAQSPSLTESSDLARRRHLRSVSMSNPSAPSLGRPMSLSSSLPTHSIPAPFPISEPGHGSGDGYTSLTLPHAAYNGKGGRHLADGKIDLVRSGKAQSSMATIEIVRGIAAGRASSSPISKARRRLSFGIGKGGRKHDKDSETPAHLRATLPLPVAFTAHIPPPTFVSMDHILVQVFAVGLDALDSLIVHEKAERRGNGGTVIGKKRGFIPGRGFVGRAVECGFDVDSSVCKRGEWVVGLLDVRKCGALAEYVIAERHRVCRVKQPKTKGATLFPPRQRIRTRTLSLPSEASASSSTGANQPSAASDPNALTPVDLALIPISGVPAHRAVRSFADIISIRRNKGGRARILVLNGHDGAGAIALQMLAKKKARVCVQVPESAVRDEESEEESEGSTLAASLTRRGRVDARLRGWGAEEVFVGEPLAVLEHLIEDEKSFDGVLDTIGGVEIWETAHRLLASYPSISCAVSDAEDAGDEEPRKKKKAFVCPAQFTTLVGDMPSRAIPGANDNIRLGLRSLRRAVSTSNAPAKGSSSRTFGRKKSRVKRMVGYAWVSVAADVDEGEDVRDSLAAVVPLVEGNQVRPWAGVEEDEDRVVTFERAPEAFRRDADGPRSVLQDAGTCVVKIGAWS